MPLLVPIQGLEKGQRFGNYRQLDSPEEMSDRLDQCLHYHVAVAIFSLAGH